MKKKKPMPMHTRMKICPLLKPSTISFLHVSFPNTHTLCSFKCIQNCIPQAFLRLLPLNFFFPRRPTTISPCHVHRSIFFIFIYFLRSSPFIPSASFFDMLSCCTGFSKFVYILYAHHFNCPVLFPFYSRSDFHLLSLRTQKGSCGIEFLVIYQHALG